MHTEWPTMTQSTIHHSLMFPSACRALQDEEGDRTPGGLNRNLEAALTVEKQRLAIIANHLEILVLLDTQITL
jgi:hypothetical protein